MWRSFICFYDRIIEHSFSFHSYQNLGWKREVELKLSSTSEISKGNNDLTHEDHLFTKQFQFSLIVLRIIGIKYSNAWRFYHESLWIKKLLYFKGKKHFKSMNFIFFVVANSNFGIYILSNEYVTVFPRQSTKEYSGKIWIVYVNASVKWQMSSVNITLCVCVFFC